MYITQSDDGSYKDLDGNVVDLTRFNISKVVQMAPTSESEIVSVASIPETQESSINLPTPPPPNNPSQVSSVPSSDVFPSFSMAPAPTTLEGLSLERHRSGERKLVGKEAQSDFMEDHLLYDITDIGNCN